jgi:multisubunit Na+/H+ antiporter MnhB subunit
MMRRRLNSINELHILRSGIQSTAGVLAMSVAVLTILRFFSGQSAWLLALSGIAVGALVYILVMVLTRVSEFEMLVDAIHRRLR